MDLKNLEPLQPLDLEEYNTVGETVRAMRQCSFGARMLGETADSLYTLIAGGTPPLVVYDGKQISPLGTLLRIMQAEGLLDVICTSRDYWQLANRGGVIVVVDRYAEMYEDILYGKPDRAIFINDFGLAKPGQVRDGYFPDAVFADPRFVMPVLYRTLQERMGIKRTTVLQLFNELDFYGGLAREVHDGAQTLQAMVNDPECTVFLTISGAMTIAKMSLVICEMIDRGMVDYIAATGALMAHGLIETVGLQHYKYDPAYSDALLAEAKLNRVTDTLEPETNFSLLDQVLGQVLDSVMPNQRMSSYLFHRLIGARLCADLPEHARGILKSAYEQQVPVVVPAFTDSEIGNDVYVHNLKRRQESRPEIIMNPELDTELLLGMAATAKRMGIFSIGGGVPRNNTQNVAPLIEIANERLGPQLPEKQFFYGCRICPDKMYYGHLSGCTYSENASWRKMDLSGRFSEVHADATLILPFLVKYLMETQVR